MRLKLPLRAMVCRFSVLLAVGVVVLWLYISPVACLRVLMGSGLLMMADQLRVSVLEPITP